MRKYKTKNLSAATILIATVASIQPLVAEESTPGGRLSVSATGSAQAAPDMAIVTLSVIHEAETAGEALAKNTAAMTDIMSWLTDIGVAERDLQTSRFSIDPRYNHHQSNNGEYRAPTIAGYLVSNALTVRVRELESLGTLLDHSVQLGVNQGGDIRFTNDDITSIMAEARVSAMLAAKAKAETLAGAAGLELGRILEITESSQINPIRGIATMERMEVMGDASSVPVAAGENSYSVTVNVTFALP